MSKIRHILLASATVLFIGTTSAFAQFPVVDAASVANTARAAASMAAQVNQLTEVARIGQTTLQTLGSFGVPVSGITNQLAAWQNFAGGGLIGQTLSQYGYNPCSIMGCDSKSGDTIVWDDPKTGNDIIWDDPKTGGPSIDKSRSFVLSSLYSGKAVGAEESKQYVEARQRATREASLAGYGLAIVSRQDLAKTQDKGKSLETIVNSATDLRGDVRANTAVAMAQHQQMTQMVALLSSLVEIEATKTISSDGTIIVPGGGTKLPNVYNPKDYTQDGRRISVTK